MHLLDILEASFELVHRPETDRTAFVVYDPNSHAWLQRRVKCIILIARDPAQNKVIGGAVMLTFVYDHKLE